MHPADRPKYRIEFAVDVEEYKEKGSVDCRWRDNLKEVRECVKSHFADPESNFGYAAVLSTRNDSGEVLTDFFKK